MHALFLQEFYTMGKICTLLCSGSVEKLHKIIFLLTGGKTTLRVGKKRIEVLSVDRNVVTGLVHSFPLRISGNRLVVRG